MRTNGFTLIELLVVIAIIGLLSSVVLASLNQARVRAQDAKRIAEARALKSAIEAYYAFNGEYPHYGSADFGYTITVLSSYLVPAYIQRIPTDTGAPAQWQYVWSGSVTRYGLYVYTSSGWCKTGANVAAGWWSTNTPLCSF